MGLGKDLGVGLGARVRITVRVTLLDDVVQVGRGPVETAPSVHAIAARKDYPRLVAYSLGRRLGGLGTAASAGVGVERVCSGRGSARAAALPRGSEVSPRGLPRLDDLTLEVQAALIPGDEGSSSESAARE